MNYRILIVSNANGDAANLLWTRGHSAHRLTLCVPGNSVEVGDAPELDDVLALPTLGNSKVPSSRMWRSGLQSVIRQQKPDIVHFVGEPWYPDLTAIRATRTSLVVHGAENRLAQGSVIKDKIRIRIAEHNLKRASGAVAWNQAAAKNYKQLIGDLKIPVIVAPAHTRSRRHYSQSPPRNRDRRDSRLHVIFVGRLVPEKGVGVLIEAVAPLKEWITLTIVGDGPEREHLESSSRDLRHIFFLGSLSQVESQERIGESDVLVLPSLDAGHVCEQFGLVLLEAMAEGTAILASSACSIPEVVGDPKSLFPPGNALELRKGLYGLATSRTELSRRKLSSFDRYSSFSPDALMGVLDGFWDAVGSSRHTP